jgi:hypothetical protein
MLCLKFESIRRSDDNKPIVIETTDVVGIGYCNENIVLIHTRGNLTLIDPQTHETITRLNPPEVGRVICTSDRTFLIEREE